MTFRHRRPVLRNLVRTNPVRDPRTLLALALGGFVAFFAVKAVSYIVNPWPPFGFYYDLGVNYVATEYMVRAFASWRDVLDNLGWASWGDVPNFYFNPELSYLSLVPPSIVVHNVWFWIKTVQALQVVVAGIGAAMLYATFFRRSIWAVVAGLLYALLPATALEIRGNIDIGWAIALLPLSLWASLALGRRFGERALPACGVILSICGFCLAAEFVFFVSIPAYVFVAATLVRRERPVRGVIFALVGMLCILGLGSYFVLTTVVGQHLFTDPVGRTDALASGSQLDLFSESWYGLLALLPREFLISDFAQFNARSSLGSVVPASAVIWIAALSTLSVAWRISRSRTYVAALCIGGLLLALSLGTTLPLGAQLWATLRFLPAFSLIRSPDRFLTLPLLFIIVAAAAGLQRFAERRGVLPPALSLAAVVMTLAVFLHFDFGQHWLTNEGDFAALEPDLAAVNARVAAAGGRTVSYALTRGGSEFYTTGYGVPTPTLWYFWDIAGHYHDDGLEGYGIYRRAAVHTVVATPKWWVGDDRIPAASQIETDLPGETMFSGSDGVIVKRIAGGGALSQRTSACVHGGPGLLDWATAIPALSALTYVTPAASCSLDAFFDYDPDPADSAKVIAQWNATDLAPNLPSLRDADYAFAVGKLFVNDAWYRNAIDGDETSSQAGARNVTAPTSFSMPLGKSVIRAGETLYVRLASHTAGRVTVVGNDGRSASAAIVPVAGMRWYSVPLREFSGRANLTLRIEPFTASRLTAQGEWTGIALDRVSILEGHLRTAGPRRSASAVLFSVAHLVNIGARTDDTANGKLLSIERADVAPDPLNLDYEKAQNGFGTITYRWSGSPGDYVISAVAHLAGPGASIALTTRRGFDLCCSATAGYDASAKTTQLQLRARLARNSVVKVRLIYPRATEGTDATLTSLAILPSVSQVAVSSDQTGRETAILDSSDPSSLVRQASVVRDVDFEPGYARGRAGSALEYRFAAVPGAKTATLSLDSAGRGDATARFDCDGHAITKTIAPPATSLTVSGDNLRRCRARIAWERGSVDIRTLRFDALGDGLSEARGRVWLPRGNYTIRIFERSARQRNAALLFDGRDPGSTIRLAAAGYHALVLRHLSTRDRVLGFIGTTAPSQSPAMVNADQRSTLDWRVRMRHAGVLEVASFPDGNWQLASDERGGGMTSGTRCDLVNTCFLDVAAGNYRLHHVWPATFRLGLLLSVLTLGVAVLVLVAPPLMASSRQSIRAQRRFVLETEPLLPSERERGPVQKLQE